MGSDGMSWNIKLTFEGSSDKCPWRFDWWGIGGDSDHSYKCGCRDYVDVSCDCQAKDHVVNKCCKERCPKIVRSYGE